ncbi:hypothetical protein H4Q26_011794 [Puccinia striiformis f. sp. tritici PST-130]|nr:hypothetical protein H4Q26_011794 [Puccinia striiformis f. sp. tritici PST-130]
MSDYNSMDEDDLGSSDSISVVSERLEEPAILLEENWNVGANRQHLTPSQVPAEIPGDTRTVKDFLRPDASVNLAHHNPEIHDDETYSRWVYIATGGCTIRMPNEPDHRPALLNYLRQEMNIVSHLARHPKVLNTGSPVITVAMLKEALLMIKVPLLRINSYGMKCPSRLVSRNLGEESHFNGHHHTFDVGFTYKFNQILLSRLRQSTTGVDGYPMLLCLGRVKGYPVLVHALKATSAKNMANIPHNTKMWRQRLEQIDGKLLKLSENPARDLCGFRFEATVQAHSFHEAQEIASRSGYLNFGHYLTNHSSEHPNDLLEFRSVAVNDYFQYVREVLTKLEAVPISQRNVTNIPVDKKHRQMMIDLQNALGWNLGKYSRPTKWDSPFAWWRQPEHDEAQPGIGPMDPNEYRLGERGTDGFSSVDIWHLRPQRVIPCPDCSRDPLRTIPEKRPQMTYPYGSLIKEGGAYRLSLHCNNKEHCDFRVAKDIDAEALNVRTWRSTKRCTGASPPPVPWVIPARPAVDPAINPSTPAVDPATNPVPGDHTHSAKSAVDPATKDTDTSAEKRYNTRPQRTYISHYQPPKQTREKKTIIFPPSSLKCPAPKRILQSAMKQKWTGNDLVEKDKVHKKVKLNDNISIKTFLDTHQIRSSLLGVVNNDLGKLSSIDNKVPACSFFKELELLDPAKYYHAEIPQSIGTCQTSTEYGLTNGWRFTRNFIKGDGNCLFRAVAFWHYSGNQGRQGDIRQRCYDELMACPKGHYITDRASWDVFLNDTRDTLTLEDHAERWGGEDHLVLLAHTLGVALVVFSPQTALTTTYKNEDQEGRIPVYFLIYLGNHYEVLFRKNSVKVHGTQPSQDPNLNIIATNLIEMLKSYDIQHFELPMHDIPHLVPLGFVDGWMLSDGLIDMNGPNGLYSAVSYWMYGSQKFYPKIKSRLASFITVSQEKYYHDLKQPLSRIFNQNFHLQAIANTFNLVVFAAFYNKKGAQETMTSIPPPPQISKSDQPPPAPHAIFLLQNFENRQWEIIYHCDLHRFARLPSESLSFETGSMQHQNLWEPINEGLKASRNHPKSKLTLLKNKITNSIHPSGLSDGWAISHQHIDSELSFYKALSFWKYGTQNQYMEIKQDCMAELNKNSQLYHKVHMKAAAQALSIILGVGEFDTTGSDMITLFPDNLANVLETFYLLYDVPQDHFEIMFHSEMLASTPPRTNTTLELTPRPDENPFYMLMLRGNHENIKPTKRNIPTRDVLEEKCMLQMVNKWLINDTEDFHFQHKLWNFDKVQKHVINLPRLASGWHMAWDYVEQDENALWRAVATWHYGGQSKWNRLKDRLRELNVNNHTFIDPNLNLPIDGKSSQEILQFIVNTMNISIVLVICAPARCRIVELHPKFHKLYEKNDTRKYDVVKGETVRVEGNRPRMWQAVTFFIYQLGDRFDIIYHDRHVGST